MTRASEVITRVSLVLLSCVLTLGLLLGLTELILRWLHPTLRQPFLGTASRSYHHGYAPNARITADAPCRSLLYNHFRVFRDRHIISRIAGGPEDFLSISPDLL